MLGSFIEPHTSLTGISKVSERSSTRMHLCCRWETRRARRHFEYWLLRLDPRPSRFNHLAVWLLLKSFQKFHVFQGFQYNPKLLLKTVQATALVAVCLAKVLWKTSKWELHCKHDFTQRLWWSHLLTSWSLLSSWHLFSAVITSSLQKHASNLTQGTSKKWKCVINRGSRM